MTVTSHPQIALEPDYAHYRAVPFAKYRAIVDQFIRQNRPRTRVTFYKGEMEIMTKRGHHEGGKTTVARLIETYALEMDIDITGLGETTWAREDVEAGLEADECYYVQSPPPPEEVRHELIDLTRFPPPDLAIEVEATRGSIPKLPVYAALGIPEVWRLDRGRIVVLHRAGPDRYEPAERSRAFPALDMNQFNGFLDMALKTSQHEAVKALRDWARSV